MEKQAKTQDIEDRLKKSEARNRILEAKLKNQLDRYARFEDISRKSRSATEQKLGRETRKNDLALSQVQNLEEQLIQTGTEREQLAQRVAEHEFKNSELERTLKNAQQQLAKNRDKLDRQSHRLEQRERELKRELLRANRKKTEQLREKHERDCEALCREKDAALSKLRIEKRSAQDRFSKILQKRTRDYNRINEELQRTRTSPLGLIGASRNSTNAV